MTEVAIVRRKSWTPKLVAIFLFMFLGGVGMIGGLITTDSWFLATLVELVLGWSAVAMTTLMIVASSLGRIVVKGGDGWIAVKAAAFSRWKRVPVTDSKLVSLSWTETMVRGGRTTHTLEISEGSDVLFSSPFLSRPGEIDGTAFQDWRRLNQRSQGSDPTNS